MRLAAALAVLVVALPAAAEEAVGWAKLRAWAAGAELDGEPTSKPPGSEAERAATGKELFGTYCARCHGHDGKGKGAGGQDLSPPPANLTEAATKFRSTAREHRPLELDLFRTITRGLKGTAMPAFADLPEADRWALAAFVRSLQAGVPDGKPVPVPRVPADLASPERIARGEAAYAKLGCVGCHGPSGKGDGPIASALFGPDGKPLRVRSFEAEVPKRSRRPEELYLTLVAGIARSPMPAFHTAKVEDVWDVVAWIRAKLPKEGTVTSAQEQEGMQQIVTSCQAPPAPAASK